jgi:pilus assembly protein Flp/PilA
MENGMELARNNKRDTYGREEVNTMLFAPKEKGQGLVEYALILVLVAIVVIVILALLGPAIGNVFSSIMTAI